VIFRKKDAPRGALATLVDERMPEADDETRALVTAVAGLCASVALADGVYAPEEKIVVRRELERVHVLDASTIDAICDLLERDIQKVTAAGDQRWARFLRDLLERPARLEVLEALVEIAAADGEIAMSETNHLRRLALALGLSQDEYLALQSKHRDKLSLLG